MKERSGHKVIIHSVLKDNQHAEGIAVIMLNKAGTILPKL